MHVYRFSHFSSEVLHSWPVGFDLMVLCDLAERLSGLFIVAHRANSQGGLPHYVTLPRSWLIKLNLRYTDPEKDTSTFLAFAETMIELMKQIDKSEEEFVVHGDRIAGVTGPLYIARM